MTANLAVRHARQRLGRVGAGLAAPPTPATSWNAELARLEKLGYRSAWTNEGVGGKETFTALALALAATDSLVLGSGIANIWARHAATMQASAATLADAYPGRFVLGVGVSHRFVVEPSGQTFTSPLRTQREYLERMRAAAGDTVRPEIPFATLVGANGPKMLELSAEYADGATPSNMPVAHTARARELLGPDKLLIVGVSAILDDDLARARGKARQSPLVRMPGSPQLRALRQFGYPDRELTDGCADRVIDDAFALGGTDAITARVREHLEAGADHVVVHGTFLAPLDAQVDELERLSPALDA